MEGCGYRDLQTEFDALGVTIVAVGFDSPVVNSEWAEEESFQFDLWTDGDRQLATYYDAVDSPLQARPDRVTKVLDADGVLVLEYVESVIVGTHPDDVLEDCRALFGG
ncbi:MAG: redoxin domain-containing protein [Deltaproteobacteria bacterium]|nr:redoxin domain-containing protein [Deltaproteobacteria bacterium]